MPRTPRRYPRDCRKGGLAATLCLGVALGAAGSDTATVQIRSEGPRVRVQLRGPAAGLVGFEHGPRTAAERETLALAAQNLKTGDALVRFNSQAGCRLERAEIDADPAPKGKAAGELGASYEFRCDQPGALASAALGLFIGFPALARAHVHYEVTGGAGETVATPGNPVVSLVPLH